MRRLFLLFVLTILIISCIPTPTPEPIPPPKPTTNIGPNLLIDLQGEAKLHRDGWHEAYPVGIGTMIQFDDLLDVVGQADILCGDLTPLKTVSGLDESSPCPRGAGWLEQNGAKYKAGIASTTDIPYVEHPRHTLVLNQQPLLRWHDTGANYTVMLMQGGQVVWLQDDVVGHELRYPNRDLLPGQDYLLLVIDKNTGKSSKEDPERGLGFRLVSQAERAEIETKQAKIDQLTFPNEAMHDFTLAVHYASWQGDNDWGLWSEAQLLLESLDPADNAPAIHLWQGDISRNMRLRLEAETAYQLALQQADSLGDQETQAAAHFGLWQTSGDESHCQTAIELYGKLGDQQQAEWVEQNCKE
ncbi:hypothetical protein QUF58_13645 [Anaerolineales bacterium HSG24]|nr:hypothetical protein [Anaerolineales bacterium HSG24]